MMPRLLLGLFENKATILRGKVCLRTVSPLAPRYEICLEPSRITGARLIGNKLLIIYNTERTNYYKPYIFPILTGRRLSGLKAITYYKCPPNANDIDDCEAEYSIISLPKIEDYQPISPPKGLEWLKYVTPGNIFTSIKEASPLLGVGEVF